MKPFGSRSIGLLAMVRIPWSKPQTRRHRAAYWYALGSSRAITHVPLDSCDQWPSCGRNRKKTERPLKLSGAAQWSSGGKKGTVDDFVADESLQVQQASTDFNRPVPTP